MYLECHGSQGSTWTVTEPCHTARQESLDHDFMKMATALATKIAEQGISSFRRLLLRQKEDLLYRPDHSYPLSYLSSGAHKWSRLQRQGCSLTPFSFRKEMRLKRGMYIWCVSERRTARVDNVQLRGMCSTRGESASSQDLQKHIAATTGRLSQTAPVLANQSWLLPANTCPALTEPVTTAALWKCGRVEGRDKHGKAAADWRRWWHCYLLPSTSWTCSPPLCSHQLGDYPHIASSLLPVSKDLHPPDWYICLLLITKTIWPWNPWTRFRFQLYRIDMRIRLSTKH